MKLRDVVTEEVLKASSGGSYDELESPVVKPGRVFEVRHVAVENRTHSYTRLVIGVADGVSFFQKEEEDSPSANNIYWTRSKFLVPSGKKLRVRLAGCTSGDNLYLWYEGYIWEVD